MSSDSSAPGSDRDFEERKLQVLVGIGAELSAIRAELQRLNGGGVTPDTAMSHDATSEFECRCGLQFDAERTAQKHATEDHGAPAENWREMYE